MAGSAWTNQVVSLVIVAAGGGFQGEFVYSPSPGAGNLLASSASSATTDPYGNAVLQGTTAYQTGLGPIVFAVNLNGGNVAWYTASSQAGPWTQLANIGVNFVNGIGQELLLQLAGFGFQALSQAPPRLAGGAVLWADANNNLENLLSSGWTGTLATSLSSVSPITVNQATSTPLTAAYPIPGNDMSAGTKYRLTASGWGIWGSTQQALAVGPGFGGSRIRTETIPSTFLAALSEFEWSAVYNMTCLGAGVSGHVWLSSVFTISKVGSGTTSPLSFCVGSNTSSTGEAIDTTSATTVGYFASWASTTGTPGIVCTESSLERIGT